MDESIPLWFVILVFAVTIYLLYKVACVIHQVSM